jgi:hypothetical protein
MREQGRIIGRHTMISLSALRKRMREGRFARLQRRRVQTEGRIGILKSGFLGQPMRGNGFAHRELALPRAAC